MTYNILRHDKACSELIEHVPTSELGRSKTALIDKRHDLSNFDQTIDFKTQTRQKHSDWQFQHQHQSNKSYPPEKLLLRKPPCHRDREVKMSRQRMMAIFIAKQRQPKFNKLWIPPVMKAIWRKLSKFKKKRQLRLRKPSVQSGAEKSVTTALYIMALQEMTEVPFRCVDEINQGMDEHNEKRVWELLVESAESHSAQFFYLAPKFPQHLKFDKNKNGQPHCCV